MGEDILLLDIGAISILADYFIVCSAESERQMRSIVRDVRQETKESFEVRPLKIEGEPADGWILMDYGSVVVHIFAPEARAYYDLEGLWKEGRVVVRLL
jgi:ribosome-associated protein